MIGRPQRTTRTDTLFPYTTLFRSVRSPEPMLSPSWSPDGRKLAYVSFEKGNSSIYIQDITTGSRELISSFRGINSSPAFSPDGRRLALTLSRSGTPDIYLMDLGRSEERRVWKECVSTGRSRWSPEH